MILWRISNHLSLAGDGGMRASGRWHTRGHRVVYCSENPAAALLEIVVHFEIELRDLPTRYRLLKIRAPENLVVEQVPPEHLPADWTEQTAMTRSRGDRWLDANNSALLRVPSVVVPETFNVLLNPAHQDARGVVVVQETEHAIDPRLVWW